MKTMDIYFVLNERRQIIYEGSYDECKDYLKENEPKDEIWDLVSEHEL